MDIMLHYSDTTFDSSQCTSNLQPKFKNPPFDLQIDVNDCTVNELLLQLYSANLLKIPIKAKILTTSKLRTLVGKDIVKKFGSDEPCKLIISPTETPFITKHYVSESYNPGNFWEYDGKF